jgi:hypothetical protein
MASRSTVKSAPAARVISGSTAISELAMIEPARQHHAGRHRMRQAEEEALAQLDAEIADHLEFGAAFDALGDEHGAEGLGEP